MEDSHGIRIALSPVQLVAVLSDKSVSEGETLSNRLWGDSPRIFIADPGAGNPTTEEKKQLTRREPCFRGLSADEGVQKQVLYAFVQSDQEQLAV